MSWPKGTFFTFCALSLLARSAGAFDSVQLKKTLASPPSAKSFTPAGVALDATGRLWVTDSANDAVDLYAADGSWQKTIGHRGIGAGEFNQPHGIAIDADGRVYVADTGNHRIVTLTSEGVALPPFGEKGTQPGQLNRPWSLAVSRDGVLAIADKDNSAVQLFSRDGVFYQTFDAGGPADALAIDDGGRIYIAHAKLKIVERRSAAGQLLTTYTGVEPALNGFEEPTAIAVNPSGLLYIADADAHQFRELDGPGHTLGTFGRSGSGAGQFRSISGIAVMGETVAVADDRTHRITLFTLSHTTLPSALTPGPVLALSVRRQSSVPVSVDQVAWATGGSLQMLSVARAQMITLDLATQVTTQMDLKKELHIKIPSGMTMAPSSGALFISDSGGNRVVKIDRTGKLLLEFGKSDAFFKSGQGELSKPQGMACTPQGVLMVADSGNGRFEAFNHQGLFQFSGGSKGNGLGELKLPVSIALDKEKIYVADPGNRKVVLFNASGRYLREISDLGPESLVDPRGVAVDREGNLFILDAARGRILVFTAELKFIGAFGTLGVSGGLLNHPRGFAINDNGDLYVAEENRLQIFHVVLQPPTPTGLVATPGEGYVTLRWDAVNTRFPAKYVVYRRASTGDVQTIKETVDTTASDDSLTANTSYFYSVAAESVQGATSIPSASVSVMAKPLASGPRLEILSAQIDDVFSAHYKYYTHTPLGRVVIRNNGQSPVQKVKVSFDIQGYMDFPSEVSVPELHSAEQEELPFSATFNNKILEVSETTPIQAQVTLTYYNGDQPVTVEKNLPFKLFSRNTIRWDKKERLAAFITPNDPPVLEFTRQIAMPFLQAHEGAPLPPPIAHAWIVFNGLGVYGMHYLARPTNPYDNAQLDSSTVDTLQFARETLTRQSGDCADVVALLASALESLSITTCALDAPGHLFLMFDTGVSNLSTLGLPKDQLVFYAGTYWIPLEATMIGSSFLEAWKQGADEYRRWSHENKLSVIDTHIAWATFEPATMPESAARATAPTREVIEEKFLSDWKALVDLRWTTSLAAAQAAVAATPADGSPWLRMGYLAVEYHRLDEARQFFTRAESDPASVSAAHNNLGNLAAMRGDSTDAEAEYAKAIEKDPKDAGISLNQVRLFAKNKETQKAETAYQKAITLDPTLKDNFPDVASLAP